MCTATSDDYSILAHGRVIDKAQAITYDTYINEVDDNFQINTDGSGTMVSTFAAWLQQEIIDEIDANMGVSSEVSGIKCFIDPEQNVIEQGGVNIVVTVIPEGYLDEIDIQLGFGLG